jgi:hypothetical protein
MVPPVPKLRAGDFAGGFAGDHGRHRPSARLGPRRRLGCRHPRAAPCSSAPQEAEEGCLSTGIVLPCLARATWLC